MVYRTEKYQKLKTEVEKQSKKCKLTENIFIYLNIFIISKIKKIIYM